MRIFYAVQATGNGHIARAIELLPFLQQYGTVDIFLSGNNSSLQFALPVKFKSKGISLFYTKTGRLDYSKIWRELSLVRIRKEAKELPVEKYDLVINDFEAITSLACRLKDIPSVQFGHQASFQSASTPRPPHKSIAGELVLRNYATATSYIGLHFEKYDDFIYAPVIKKEILQAEPVVKDHVSVYLPQYDDAIICDALKQVKDMRFEIFSKTAKSVSGENNITIMPVSNDGFTQSLINCTGIITGAGFETPAEALYLGKKLMCIPIKGQYEQLCNAAALQKFGVPIHAKIDKDFNKKVIHWLHKKPVKPLQLFSTTKEVIEKVIEKAG